MPLKDRVEEADSSPAEPSAWQLRFGRQPANQRDAGNKPPQQDSTASTASIAEQLFKSLAAREQSARPEQELSRECAEQLLGKRNAFVRDLRVNRCSAEEVESDEHAVTLAKEIIRARFDVENQADALRRTGKTKSSQNHAHQAKNQSAPAPERLRQLRQAQARRDQDSSLKSKRLTSVPAKGGVDISGGWNRGRSEPEDNRSGGNGDDRHLNATAEPTSSNHRSRRAPIRVEATAQSRQAALKRLVQPQCDPVAQMEQRQERVRQMKDARKLQRSASSSGSARSTRGHSNQCDDGEQLAEQQQLQERIARITADNQRAVELAARVALQRKLFAVKSVAFAAWKQLYKIRQECAIVAMKALRWRTLKRIMTNWRHCCDVQKRERLTRENQARRLHEQSLWTKAVQFHRRKSLPRWFYRWVVSLSTKRELQNANNAVQRRRENAQRLMERLIRGSDAAEEGDGLASESPEIDPPKAVQSSDAATARLQRKKLPVTVATARPATVPPARSKVDAANPGAHPNRGRSSPSLPPPPPAAPAREPTPSSTPPCADPVYVAMMERANARKERRDKLQRKYDLAQQEKHEAVLMAIEDREATLLRCKELERQRLRDKKREALSAARDKQERLEHQMELARRAHAFNRVRLLRQYGFFPWRREFDRRRRIESRAVRWHALRLVHKHWAAWLEFVVARHRDALRREQERLVAADNYYSAVLSRRVWHAWQLHRQQIQARGVAVLKQRRRTAMCEAWRQWRAKLAVVRANNHRKEREAARTLDRSHARRVLRHWRVAVEDIRRSRAHQREKEQLWAKVRGWLDEES